MKIDISKIDEGRFMVREEINQEYVKKLSQSLLADGQWNPIIIRPKEGGKYELIAGHYRLQATKEAGLSEIEATIRDLTDEEADFLSLKTNLLRLEMTAMEQGKQLVKILENYGINQSELSRRLDVSAHWISDRVRLALDLHEDVVKALGEKRINFAIAVVIGGVPLMAQPIFLQIILDRNISNNSEAVVLRRQFLNNTIFTIGYQGRDLVNFVDVLKNNGIELVMDVRYSVESSFKPDFSGVVLKRELERNKIKYEHQREFGVPYILQEPYKEDKFSYECLQQWYIWHIKKENKFDEFIEHIKKSGKVAIMCVERYAKPVRNQLYACHRDILAKLILQNKSIDPLLRYEKRIDL